MFFVQTSTPTLGMHQKLTKNVKYCMKKNQPPTKTPVALTDDPNINSFVYRRYTDILGARVIG